MTKIITHVRKHSTKVLLAMAAGAALLGPSFASARDFDDRRPDRGYDRGDLYRSNDRNDANRGHDRDDRHDGFSDFQIGFGSHPTYQRQTERVWVEPVYRTVYDRVWRDAVVQDVCDHVWVEPVYRTREVVRFDYGRRIVSRERVLVSPGHYEDQHRQVVISEGHWDNVERQELIVPGHWEERTRDVRIADDHPSFNLRFDYRGR